MRYLLAMLLLCIMNMSYALYPRPEMGDMGMVVSEQHLATEAGIEILKQGGNAIDAAVGVGYALSVVDACCGGVGGGGFMLIHHANGDNDILNFREKAPGDISPEDFFTVKGELKVPDQSGYLYVGVPGTVMGLNTALEKYGTLSLPQVMAPAIDLAENGYHISANALSLMHNFLFPNIEGQANVKSIYEPGGKPLQADTLLVQKDLAHTLTLISRQGADAFYKGDIAKAIVKASRDNGGKLSLRDFENYRIKFQAPLTCQYRGYDVLTMPPPGSGMTVCQILTVMDHYPVSTFDFHASQNVHLNAQAMLYAFMDRNEYLGDPEFVVVPVDQLLSEQHIESVVARISPDHVAPYKNVMADDHESMHTTHFVVADKAGNVVSVTFTLNSFYGAKVMAGNTGFFLNNEMDDFTLKAGLDNKFKLKQGVSNVVAPNKQPASSMSPTLLMKDGNPVLALGAAGGPTIITQIVQVIENMVDFGMDISTAVNMPHYHMQGYPESLYMEAYAFDENAINQLEEMGYDVQLGSMHGHHTWGQIAAIAFDNGVMEGAMDYRRPMGGAMGLQSELFVDPVLNGKSIHMQ